MYDFYKIVHNNLKEKKLCIKTVVSNATLSLADTMQTAVIVNSLQSKWAVVTVASNKLVAKVMTAQIAKDNK